MAAGYKRTGDVFYNFLDQYTGEPVEYKKTTVWWDGRTPMQDRMCDGVIYRKIGTEYVKRVYSGPIDARWLGLVADVDYNLYESSYTDNRPKLQNFLDTIQPGTIAEIHFPKGGYFFSDTINVRGSKGINFSGVKVPPYVTYQSGGTQFSFAVNKGGINILGGKEYNTIAEAEANGGKYGNYQVNNGKYFVERGLPSTVSDIGLQGNHTDGNQTSGIYHEVICFFYRVWARGFGNAGFYTFAVVQYPMYGNSSLSYYEGCRAIGNGLNQHTHPNMGDGFYQGGPDANAITYMNCISVENRRWGFMDNSFLGNFFYGCQSASNGGTSEGQHDRGGGFCLNGPANYGTVRDCYSEGDQLPNQNNSLTANVTSGIHANGWIGVGSVSVGYNNNLLKTPRLETNNIDFHYVDFKQTWEYGKSPRLSINMPSTDASYNSVFNALAFGHKDSPFGRIGSFGGLGEVYRGIAHATVKIHSTRWNGNRLSYEGSNTNLLDEPHLAGDEIIQTPFRANMPEKWVVVKDGRPNVTSSPMTITYGGQNQGDSEVGFITLQNEADYSKFKIGDRVTLGYDPNAVTYIAGVVTQPYVAVNKPAGMTINNGDRIDWMGRWIDPMQPIGYTNSTILLDYVPYSTTHTVGEQVWVNPGVVPGMSTIKSVNFVKGVQLIELTLPENMPVSYFNEGNQIGWGNPSTPRKPIAYNHTDPANPTVTLAFPMANIEVGAEVQVNGVKTTVATMSSKGIITSRNFPLNPTGYTISINQLKLKAVGDGMGPLSERPNMAGIEGPWRYFDNQANIWYTWTGTTWI